MKPWSDNQMLHAASVVRDIRFPDMTFSTEMRNSMGFLFLTADGTCNVTGKPYQWKSRKWLLHPDMTDGEIVQTAFKCLLTALEHEAREQFSYKGAMVMNPHHDIDRLVEMAGEPGFIKEREPPVKMGAASWTGRPPHDQT